MSSTVDFRPGDEFPGSDPADLLPRLRLSPDASPVDLMQSSFTVYIDDTEYDVDPLTAIGEFDAVVSVTDHDALGYVISRCGGWWSHWANESVDEYIYLPELDADSAVSLLFERSGLYDLAQDAEWTWHRQT